MQILASVYQLKVPGAGIKVQNFSGNPALFFFFFLPPPPFFGMTTPPWQPTVD